MSIIERIATIAAGIVASRVKEAEATARYYQRQSDVWRGIAAAMGYEPKAHMNVRPKEAWLIERIAKFRAQVVAEATTPPVKTGEG